MDQLLRVLTALTGSVEGLLFDAKAVLLQQHIALIYNYGGGELTADQVIEELRTYADWRPGQTEESMRPYYDYINDVRQASRSVDREKIMRDVTKVDNIVWMLNLAFYPTLASAMGLCNRVPEMHWYWWLKRFKTTHTGRIIEPYGAKFRRRMHRFGWRTTIFGETYREVDPENFDGYCKAQDVVASVVLLNDGYFRVTDGAEKRFWDVLRALPYDLQVLVAMRMNGLMHDTIVIDDEVWVDVLGVDMVAWRETLWPGRYA
jgi:hypothetical protein